MSDSNDTGSVQGCASEGQACMQVASRDMLRTQRKSLIAWILFWDLVAVTWLVVGAIVEPVPTRTEWIMFGVLVVATGAHTVGTRSVEERRRAGRVTGRGADSTIDHSCFFVFAAAVLVPFTLSAALLVALRVERFFIARRPLYRHTLSSAAHLVAVAGVSNLVTWSGVHLGTDTAASVLNRPLHTALVLVGAIAWYWAIQTLVVGTAVALSTGWAGWSTLGSREENTHFLLALGGAVAIALAIGSSPLMGLVVTPVAIAATIQIQREAQLRFDHRQLTIDAAHDPLTEALNRRGFDPHAEATLRVAQVTGKSAACLVLDLDRFKQWNTRLGHIDADHLLRGVARVLADGTRAEDLFCRWGGEEFVVLIPDIDAVGALAYAERLRAAVECMRVPILRPAGGRTRLLSGCTVSIGAAVAPDHATELTELQKCADAALQQAKDGGRNQVCLFKPQLDSSPRHIPGAHMADEIPSPARTYDYLLGGGNNLAVDRALAERLQTLSPNIVKYATQNRTFLRRAVMFLMQQGVRQILDLGSGIPTSGNVHQVAQEGGRQCRVVYVDTEKVAIETSHHLLQHNDLAHALCADLTDTDTVLAASRQWLDFTQPIAIIACSVLHFVPGDLQQVFTRYRDALAPGSWLVLSYAHVDGLALPNTDKLTDAADAWDASTHQYCRRSDDEILSTFDGWEIIEPGFVQLTHWKPELSVEARDVEEGPYYAAVGRKT